MYAQARAHKENCSALTVFVRVRGAVLARDRTARGNNREWLIATEYLPVVYYTQKEKREQKLGYKLWSCSVFGDCINLDFYI